MTPSTLGAAGPTGVRAADTAADSDTRKGIAIAAREFEAMFLLQMLKQMRQSMVSDEDEEPGLGSATMGDTMDSELARQLAGHSGLARVLIESFGASAPITPPIASLATPTLATPTPAASSRTTRPAVDGPVSSTFGWRQDPIVGTSRFHKGVDIRAAYGRDVSAAAGGVVVSAGTAGGYGESIVIDHGNGLRTRYAHLSSIGVGVGDSVTAGQAVGRVGQSGRATGPHLHFEVTENGNAVDPSSLALKLGGGIADYSRGSARAGAAARGDNHED